MLGAVGWWWTDTAEVHPTEPTHNEAAGGRGRQGGAEGDGEL